MLFFVKRKRTLLKLDEAESKKKEVKTWNVVGSSEFAIFNRRSSTA